MTEQRNEADSEEPPLRRKLHRDLRADSREDSRGDFQGDFDDELRNRFVETSVRIRGVILQRKLVWSAPARLPTFWSRSAEKRELGYRSPKV